MQQGSKFKDSIHYYDPLVKKGSEKGILDVAAIVLANLCVAWITFHHTSGRSHSTPRVRLLIMS